MENKVIAAAMQSRRAFDIVCKLEADKNLSPLGTQIWKGLKQYYTQGKDAECADPDIVLDQLRRRLPGHVEPLEKAFSLLPKVSAANVVEYVKENNLDALSVAIRNAFDKGNVEEASKLMEQYRAMATLSLDDATDDDKFEVLNGSGAEELTAQFKAGNTFTFSPRQLNDILDGTIPGDHILVYAPVNVGKSALAIEMAWGLCRSGKKVLFIANEGPRTRNMTRAKSRFCEMNRQQMMQDPAAADARAKKMGWDNFYLCQLYPGTVADVKRLCEEIKPDVCIVDQVINLHLGGKEPSETEKLTAVCYDLRMFYNKAHIMGISVAQADSDAIDKAVLEIKHVYYSNVGVQAQVDIMIGLGAGKGWLATGERWIQVTKNKASGIHTGFKTRLLQQISKLESY
jgi:KaiC/GvpD/RAD55 family RecA-like ATPase